MQDIDHSHPDVREELYKWGEWILKETGAEGYRLDAVKHVDVNFVNDFVREVRNRVDNVRLAFFLPSLPFFPGFPLPFLSLLSRYPSALSIRYWQLTPSICSAA